MKILLLRQSIRLCGAIGLLALPVLPPFLFRGDKTLRTLKGLKQINGKPIP